MRVTSLKLVNVRAIKSAEFHFQPGFNLIVGVNGVGKTSIFDAVLHWWRHEKDRIDGPVPRNRFVRKRDAYVRGQGQLQPYCQVAVWWLEQRLAKMAA